MLGYIVEVNNIELLRSHAKVLKEMCERHQSRCRYDNDFFFKHIGQNIVCLSISSNVHPGGNSQNFLWKFVRFLVTSKCFYGVVIHRK
jgi:hypothetical protein